MPGYFIFPSMDENHNFPPEIRQAMANYSEMVTKYAAKSVETTKADVADLNAHKQSTTNPHSVTKSQVGLGNVDNTSDIAKPISTLQKAYVDNIVGDTWSSLGSKIGFVGDSYMTGLGLTNPATERWPKKLAVMAGNIVENNVAVSGAGYSNQGAGGNSKFSTQATLLAPDCTHVIMSGGINDAPLALTDAAMKAEVTAAITAIRTRIPSVPITVISPMWSASQPSDGLLLVESQIRSAVIEYNTAGPGGVVYVERGPWLRVDRSEWQQGDGHPNLAGANAIASWVRDQLGGTPPGAETFRHVAGAAADIVVNSTNFPGYVMGTGTIRGAKSGWWILDAQEVLYNTSNGYVWLKETARKVQTRSDVQSANPMPHRANMRFYHPGGDLVVAYGYDPSVGTPTLITNGQSFLKAIYDGVH